MSDQQQQPESASDDTTGDHADVGVDPKHPHPQDRPVNPEGDSDEDSRVDHLRDSPGAAVSTDDRTGDQTEKQDVAEPNEPG